MATNAVQSHAPDYTRSGPCQAFPTSPDPVSRPTLAVVSGAADPLAAAVDLCARVLGAELVDPAEHAAELAEAQARRCVSCGRPVEPYRPGQATRCHPCHEAALAASRPAPGTRARRSAPRRPSVRRGGAR